VNTGQRFNGGFDRGAPIEWLMESRLVGLLGVHHLGCCAVQFIECHLNRKTQRRRKGSAEKLRWVETADGVAAGRRKAADEKHRDEY